MSTYSIAGVNEHFNFPWKFGIQSGAFEKKNIHLQWTDIAGGTGEMLQLLEEEKLDFAVLLTEGIISDIIRNKKAKLLQLHVTSPLLWGVHVRKEHAHLSVYDLQKMRFAISRYGSGSHMMALVLAKKEGWDTTQLQFEVVNSIEGGLQSLQNNESDVFLWEKYTTRPFLEKYGLAWIGEVPTPWPAFCLAASEKMCRKHPVIIKQLMETSAYINELYNSNPACLQKIAEMFHLSLFEVENWKEETEWNTQPGISDQDLHGILEKLHKSGLITEGEAATPAHEIKFSFN